MAGGGGAAAGGGGGGGMFFQGYSLRVAEACEGVVGMIEKAGGRVVVLNPKLSTLKHLNPTPSARCTTLVFL